VQTDDDIHTYTQHVGGLPLIQFGTVTISSDTLADIHGRMRSFIHSLLYEKCVYTDGYVREKNKIVCDFIENQCDGTLRAFN